FVEGYSITFELFGVPRHGGRLPFFPTQPGWISGVHQTGVRPVKLERERRGASDGMSEADLRAENARLRRELAEAKMDNEFLSK
ncbi:hypothetical protein QP934_011630, partial [Corynebacterium sp. MSK122]|uniref:hypothetical protein n=1 Tax=Corynebacterium sp. MSK122 TaxID=3050206 RepID=UPI003AF1ACF0